MKLTLDSEWKQIPVTSGTIDNCSTRSIEISDDDGDDDSIVIYSRQKYPFKNISLKARCGSGKATISVTDFNARLCNGGGDEVATMMDIDNMF